MARSFKKVAVETAGNTNRDYNKKVRRVNKQRIHEGKDPDNLDAIANIRDYKKPKKKLDMEAKPKNFRK